MPTVLNEDVIIIIRDLGQKGYSRPSIKSNLLKSKIVKKISIKTIERALSRKKKLKKLHSSVNCNSVS